MEQDPKKDQWFWTWIAVEAIWVLPVILIGFGYAALWLFKMFQ